MIKLYAGFHISIKNLPSVFSIQTAGWMDEKMDRHTDRWSEGIHQFTCQNWIHFSPGVKPKGVRLETAGPMKKNKKKRQNLGHKFCQAKRKKNSNSAK